MKLWQRLCDRFIERPTDDLTLNLSSDLLVALIDAGDLLDVFAADDDLPHFRRNQARDLSRRIHESLDA